MSNQAQKRSKNEENVGKEDYSALKEMMGRSKTTTKKGDKGTTRTVLNENINKGDPLIILMAHLQLLSSQMGFLKQSQGLQLYAEKNTILELKKLMDAVFKSYGMLPMDAGLTQFFGSGKQTMLLMLPIPKIIHAIQRMLENFNSLVSANFYKSSWDKYYPREKYERNLSFIEVLSSLIDKNLEPLKKFVTSGGTKKYEAKNMQLMSSKYIVPSKEPNLNAHAHVCASQTRIVESMCHNYMWDKFEQEKDKALQQEIVYDGRFLNRLSDFFFDLSRIYHE